MAHDAANELTEWGVATPVYDANGNTIGSGGINSAYDFENRLIQQGAGVSIVYDGDGNRVKKTAGGVTTTYLVDEINPTGYPQVIYEGFSGGAGARELYHMYVYGLERISQSRTFLAGSQQTQISYYVYDGHGSTRALTDPTGNVTDAYDYDAFGNLIHSTGTTPNEFLFAGEQFDSTLNLYYNRARYSRPETLERLAKEPQKVNSSVVHHAFRCSPCYKTCSRLLAHMKVE